MNRDAGVTSRPHSHSITATLALVTSQAHSHLRYGPTRYVTATHTDYITATLALANFAGVVYLLPSTCIPNWKKIHMPLLPFAYVNCLSPSNILHITRIS